MNSGLSGPMETLTVGFVAGLLIGGMAVGSCTTGGSPKDAADHDCEVAWVAANDGDPDTDPEAIYQEPWCQQHNTTMTTTGEAP